MNERRLRGAEAPALAVTLGSLVPSLVDVVSATAERSAGSISIAVLHLIYDVGLFAALGLAVDLAVFGLESIAGRRRALFYVLAGAVASALAYGLLERNFARQADVAFNGRFSAPIVAALTMGAGGAVVGAMAIARWLGRFRAGAAIAVLASLAGAIANVVLFRDDYFEAHTAVAISTAIVAGNAALPFARNALHAAEGGRRRMVLRVLLAASVLTVVIQPSNAVRMALFRSPGCAGVWVAALHRWSLPVLAGTHEATFDEKWLAPRSGEHAPTEPPLFTGPPVVVLLTVDAVRADAIADDEKSAAWRTIDKMKREGAFFTQARSPGSQTSVSLTTVFAGKYFSEMRWGRHGEGKSRFEYAAADETPRFPAVLGDAGVPTFKSVSLMFLKNEFGVAPGFEEEEVVTEGRKHARASEVMTPLLARLRSTRGAPLFAFAHLTEPHAPYDRGKLKKGTSFEKYLSEIQEVDAHLEKLVKALSTPDLAKRSILIVTSDHGEAFGEHGTYHHTKTIYEELVRVPLLVWGAGVRARKIDEPVTLVDLNPTICDLFGVPWSEDITGETLVPILRGQEPKLSRPILAEGRLRRALYAGNLKVIADLRRSTVEAYDLSVDPGELDNLFDRERARVAPLLGALDAFFETRGYKKDGYEPPYKP
jgi:arylsulfatase A-like enzyme